MYKQVTATSFSIVIGLEFGSGEREKGGGVYKISLMAIVENYEELRMANLIMNSINKPDEELRKFSWIIGVIKPTVNSDLKYLTPPSTSYFVLSIQSHCYTGFQSMYYLKYARRLHLFAFTWQKARSRQVVHSSLIIFFAFVDTLNIYC